MTALPPRLISPLAVLFRNVTRALPPAYKTTGALSVQSTTSSLQFPLAKIIGQRFGDLSQSMVHAGLSPGEAPLGSETFFPLSVTSPVQNRVVFPSQSSFLPPTDPPEP